jgi:hypothetical protein
MPKSDMRSHDTVPATPEIYILLALLLWGAFLLGRASVAFF